MVVGSEEIEPGEGWPYNTILKRLMEDPSLDAEELSKRIVEEYVAYYQDFHPQQPVTQSALCLAGMNALGEAVHSLGHCLKDHLLDQNVLGMIFSALRFAQSFSDKDYIDLAHFCKLLAETDPHLGRGSFRAIRAAALAVLSILEGEDSPVIAAKNHGPGVENAYGISIYLPARKISPLYGRLDFAQGGGWYQFLQAFIGA